MKILYNPQFQCSHLGPHRKPLKIKKKIKINDKPPGRFSGSAKKQAIFQQTPYS